MNGRGEQRFGAITYSLLAEWTGLRLETVRSYGGKRLFDPWDIAGTISWANAIRARRGLPPIGQPEPPEVHSAGPTTTTAADPLVIPQYSPYNALTAEFQD